MKGGRADRHIVGILEFVRICLFEICLFEDWAAVNPPRFLGESGSLTETTSIALTVVLGSR
jgi:hypothetical protein